MDNDETDLIEARRRLSEIDAKMRAALGSDITLRGKLYRKRISLEKKFMKQIVTASSDLIGKLGAESVIKIVMDNVLLSHSEINTIKQWITAEDENFLPGVFPCIVMIENKIAYENVHKPFVTSMDEEKEFALNLPKYRGDANQWIICQLFELEDYKSRYLGETLNREVLDLIEDLDKEVRINANKYLIYSSQGKIRNITQPRYGPESDVDVSESSGENTLRALIMGIPFSIFGKRKSALEAIDDLEMVEAKAMVGIGEFLSRKLSAKVIAMIPVFEDELQEFLETLTEETMRISDYVHERKHGFSEVPTINRDKILPPPGDPREALLNFFYLSSILCSECGKIHEDDVKITGIEDEKRWNFVIGEYFKFLIDRKDSVLPILSSDQEILMKWPETADSLRRVLLGDLEL